MIRPSDIPKGWRCWSGEYVPESREHEAGWYAFNSVIVRDCSPSYRTAGGGVQSSQLTDLPEAIDKSIANLKQRKSEADVLMKRLQRFKEYLESEK